MRNNGDPAAAASAGRAINKRGSGLALRREIMDAAVARLGEVQSGRAVTLRAIARRAGIAAPSIYLHFADRDAILDAVISESFDQLASMMLAATAVDAPAAVRVRSLCGAYLAFAAEFPGRYRVLFERTEPNLSADTRPYPEGLAVFELVSAALADAVAEGSSASVDPPGDSAALWAALHGLAVLPPATPGFPWPPTTWILDVLITGIARLAANSVDADTGRPIDTGQAR